jgi:hypothetical protein
MIKQPGTDGYVSISGGRIASILLVSICSFALAWATRSGDGNKSNTSAESAQPLPAHTKQPAIKRRPVSPAPHHQSNKGGKAHAKHNHSAQHKQDAKRNQGAQDAASQAQHSVGAGHSGKPQSDSTPTPTPEQNPSPTPATTLGLSAMATPTPSP